MGRLPINVLVIPFYIKDGKIKYALFKRADMNCWQGIAGGVEVSTVDFELSAEHNEYGWFKYNEAMDLLRWDSNKTALWELNKRLEKNKSLRTTSSQT